MTNNCIFCRIVAGEIPPAASCTRTSTCVAIRDINPAAPVHVLVIPRKPHPLHRATLGRRTARWPGTC